LQAGRISNFLIFKLIRQGDGLPVVVARAGVPTRGEWKGQSAPLATTTQATQHLTIDSPDP